jgi:glycosyltransferase involved in cell wall biosynthesis
VERANNQVTSLTVSVAMATFNGAAYLGQQLADLTMQSVLPSELVVCDDASTDDSLVILERFAASSPFPVRIHRNDERLGYRANFLKCGKLCRSDLVAFCDQDDRWVPEKIETMLACFEDADVLLAFHRAQIIADNQQPLGRFTSMPRPIGLSPPLSGSPWMFALGFTQVFRRSLCAYDRWWPLSLDHNSTHEPLAHDQWYFFLASVLGTIVHVEAPLVRYRQHDANVFGWAKAKRTLSVRLLERFGSAAWSLDRRSHAATQRAIILDEAAGALSAPYRQRALKGAIAYRHLAELCAHRTGIYTGRTMLDRARSLATLVNAHGYGANPWRFGARALAMDLIVGLPGMAPNNRLQSAGETEAAEIPTSEHRPC